MVVSERFDVVSGWSELTNVSNEAALAKDTNRIKSAVKMTTASTNERTTIGLFVCTWSFSNNRELVWNVMSWKFVWDSLGGD
jgi:hypothetical protein